MTPQPTWRLLTLAALATAGLRAQDWTDEQLVNEAKGFQSPSLTTQIEPARDDCDSAASWKAPQTDRMRDESTPARARSRLRSPRSCRA